MQSARALRAAKIRHKMQARNCLIVKRRERKRREGS